MTKDEALKLVLELLQDYMDEYGPWSDDSGVQYALRVGKEALAQPEQEPVAWVREHELPLAPGDAFSWVETFVHKTPLYTTPPQRAWVGLTDEQIETLWQNTSPYYDRQDFARAIEAKLKEKNT